MSASLIRDYGVRILQLLGEHPTITEVMVNAPNEKIWVMDGGKPSQKDIMFDDKEMHALLSVFAREAGGELAQQGKNAIVQSSYDDSATLRLRIAGIVAPYGADGGSICIRRHAAKNFSLDDIAIAGTAQSKEIEHELTKQWNAADYIRACIKAERNILISGSTDSGKTTMINAILGEMPTNIRMLTIEDTLELKSKTPNLVRFQSIDKDGVTTQELLKLALRYRPDAIVVGEVRGGEAYQLIEAWGTGHNGGVSSLHANDAEHALLRLQGLALDGAPGNLSETSAKIKIAAAVDNIIFLKKDHNTGQRRITQIARLNDKICNGSFILNFIHLKENHSL